MKVLILSFILFFAGVSSSFSDEVGIKLYKQLLDRYQSLSSYEDEGVVVYFLGEKKSKQTIPFNTYYLAPNLIRFHFIKSHPYKPLAFVKRRYVVWCDGENVYSACGNDINEETSIIHALAGFLGISRMSTHMIPSLLLDAKLGAGIDGLIKPKYVGEDDVDGRTCYHLEGERRNGYRYGLWISKDDFLIRKIKEDDTEYHYKRIHVNRKIPKEMFKLNPKGSSLK